MQTKALVVLSGGQDSTTCLAVAKSQFEEVHAVTFNYGQRHMTEIESAIAVAQAVGVSSHEIIDLGATILKSSSPLVSNNPVGRYQSADELPGGVEPTFVPGRNILFLTIAANRAAALGIRAIFTGVCEEDFGGYFDCRQAFIDAMQASIGEGIAGNPSYFLIHTPLMNLTKKDSVLLAQEMLGTDFDRVMGLTHTCYNGVKGGCGECHACILRDRGFKDAGIADPIWALRC
jgi:7-cyano-7-deazaguanine synthase